MTQEQCIKGVAGGDFGIGWDMLCRASQALLAYRGTQVNLDEILAYSGDAFSLCHAGHWQDIAYLCTPTDPMANLARACGYQYACLHDGYGGEGMDAKSRDERVEVTKATLARIIEETDAGRPVLIGGAEDHCGTWTLAVGYSSDGPKLCHVGCGEDYRWTPLRGIADGATDHHFGHWNGRFRGAIREGFVGGWQCNPAYLIGPRLPEPPTRQEATLAALRRVPELHRAPSTHYGWWGGIDYHFGAAAYTHWADDLAALDYPADLDKPRPEDAYDWYCMGNVDTQVDQVVRGRGAAARFCQSAAVMMPAAAPDLTGAAQAYCEEVGLASSAFQPFIGGTDEEREAWLSSEADREEGLEAVRHMLELETQAVQAIERALAAMA